MKSNFLHFFAVALLALPLSGCAVYMAANQPSEKNLALLSPGTPRNLIVSEFGTPITTETKDGARHDVIKFTQGYSTGAKAARAIAHGAADVFTAGLWEAVGTPVEGTFNGDQMSAEVVYDASDRVAQIIPLSNAEQMQAAISSAQHPMPKTVATSSISTLQPAP
jgi:outer membrane protein assembly factor BamE (lipoprotein component of BamABCDE complex)